MPRKPNGEDFDWMDMRLWRFFLATEREAERLMDAFGPGGSIILRRELVEYVKRIGKEVRLKLKEDLPIDLHVLPAGPRRIRIHFANIQFLARGFLHRTSVYDLVFDGKPDCTSGAKPLVRLNEVNFD